MKPITLTLLFIPFLAGCAMEWSKTGDNGVPFETAEPVCRAKAVELAERQLPFKYDSQPGPAGFPPETREDIIQQETARCLEDNGFELKRVH